MPNYNVYSSIGQVLRGRRVARVCGTCKQERSDAMFYWDAEARRSTKAGKPVTMPCRTCVSDRSRAQRKPRQDYADSIKLAAGCADCGLMSSHPEIYDFDHADPDQKVASVATLYTRGTFDQFVAEIDKCVVVCANCHRIRTRARRQVSFGRTRGAYRKGLSS